MFKRKSKEIFNLSTSLVSFKTSNMAGQLCVFLCVVLAIQWSSAQFDWNRFSAINRGMPNMPFGARPNQMPGQQQNEYQYVNCAATDQSQNELKVTFTRPTSGQNQFIQQLAWLQPQQQNNEREPVRMEFSIRSSGQQFAGNMQLVMTEYGPAAPGMCNPAMLGSIKQGFQQEQPFNPWNQMQNFNPNNNRPAGQLGPGFYLQPSQAFQISRNVEINFDEMAGSGIALCRGVNGNQCTFMLSLCCTLAKGTASMVSAQFNQFNNNNNQFGNNQNQFGNNQNPFGANAGVVGGNTIGQAGADPFAAGGNTNTNNNNQLFGLK